MGKKTVELKIVATGHKLNAEDSLMVLIDPQFGDFLDEIYFALEEVTGHTRHVVLPIPHEQMKVFSIKHPITVEQKVDLRPRIDV